MYTNNYKFLIILQIDRYVIWNYNKITIEVCLEIKYNYILRQQNGMVKKIVNRIQNFLNSRYNDILDKFL